MAFTRAYAARRIQRAFRRRKVVRAMVGYRRKAQLVRRSVIGRNNEPTFVETYKAKDVINLTPGTGTGKVFKVRITDIPQVNQYADLFKQYRINWCKVMILPKLNTEVADANAALYNLENAGHWMGNARIVYAIQDSPAVAEPVTEDEVLRDNGCKIKSFKSKWSCSFKPVPDVAQTNALGNPIYTRQKYRQWFNFDTALTGNNPEHGAVCAYISLPGTAAAEQPFQQTYFVYYKLGFTLRDPQ